MSWTPKPSATETFSRRSEPYLTQSLRARLERATLPRYATKRAALLPTLHAVQEEHGWLPPQAIEEIAAFLDLSPAETLDTASFYEEYHLKPRGEHVIGVCRSVACEFCGSPAVTDACREALGVEVGETTPDGKFTLLELECLGSCGSAPAALFDHDLHETVGPERLRAIIEEARAGKRPVVESSTSDLAAGGGAH